MDYYKGRLNVWCAISPRGKVAIHVFDKTLKSKVYVDILRTCLIPGADHLYPNGWLFQQDKHPVHTSDESSRFINREIDLIDWPTYSSDLSPIENLWPALKKKVRQRQPRSLSQLRNFIYEEWKKS